MGSKFHFLQWKTYFTQFIGKFLTFEEMEYLIHHVKFEMWPLLPVLTQAVFNVGTAFGRDKIGAQKIKKQFFSKISSIL